MPITLCILGLFKEEWSGDAFIGLNAKTYFCSGPSSKYSSKGVSHHYNLTFQDYRNVLLRNDIDNQTNKGFRYKDGKMYTYNVKKSGLSHIYVKRKVLQDGMSTTYLDI